MTSSWFFLSTLNYNARSITYQIYISMYVNHHIFGSCLYWSNTVGIETFFFLGRGRISMQEMPRLYPSQATKYILNE